MRIFDVCGTLVRDDTTIGLLTSHFSQSGRWRLWGLKLLTSRRSPLRFLVVVAERLTGRHVLKVLLVRWLRGDRVTDLAARADEYAKWLLENRRVPAVTRLLEVTDGTLILASASLSPVVEALAQRLNAQFVASSLAVRDGRYLGHYVEDLTGRKREALERKFGSQSLARYVAVSDNFSDRSLLENAEHAYVVLHKPQHLARWKGLDAKFLPL